VEPAQQAQQALLGTCPLCGATIRRQGFNDRRWREMWKQR